MSSQKSAVQLRVNLRCSFILGGIFILLYGGSLIWLASMALVWWLKALAGTAIVAMFIGTFRRHALLKDPNSIVSMVWDGGDQWLLGTASGDQWNGELLSSTFIHPWLVVFNFRVEGRRRMCPVLMLPDSTDSTTLRRLQARLRGLADSALS